MKMKLDKGDPCFVRLDSGDVVEAKYYCRCDLLPKGHVVLFGKKSIVAYSIIDKGVTSRFVYPISEMKRQMGLQ